MLTSIDFTTFPLELEQKADIIQSKPNSLTKRVFDVVISSLVIVFILLWLYPILGLLIALTSPGPILFVQLRIGHRGRPFRCYKFRTMRHESQNSTFKQTTFNDSRVTPIGRFLRKTNLDEMPQFLNVLQGNMSVIGPRPHAIQHDAEYWHLIPDYYKRYTVLPGITGLAQVRGARGITDNNQKMLHRLKYDLFYIKNHSLKQDLQIFWWTVEAMFKGDNNAW